MSTLGEIVCQRRSIRKFEGRIPSREILKDLIRYATLAPNAMNRQDWHFIVILSQEIRHKIRHAVAVKWQNLGSGSGTGEAIRHYASNFSSFGDAPVLIAVYARKPPRFLTEMLGENAANVMGSQASACMAVENLLLAACDAGLGSCVYTGCNAAELEIADILGISGQRQLVCLIALGYPAEVPIERMHKEVDEVLTIVE